MALLEASGNSLIFHISSINGDFAIPSPGSFLIMTYNLCGLRVLKSFKTNMSLNLPAYFEL